MSDSSFRLDKANYVYTFVEGRCKIKVHFYQPTADRPGGSFSIIICELYQDTSASSSHSAAARVPLPSNIYYIKLDPFPPTSTLLAAKAEICKATQGAVSVVGKNIVDFINDKLAHIAVEVGHSEATGVKVETVFNEEYAKNMRQINSKGEDDIIGKLKVGEISGVATDSPCSICLKEMENKKMKINCQHYFHYNCIAEWLLLNKNTCPLCRSPLIATS